MKDPFVHLHVHTDKSILDGHSTIPELAKEAARLGQPALAITDHGSLAGARKHWEACNDAGIKPIIGCEFYVAPDRLDLKEPVYWGQPLQRSDDVSNQGSYCHITVLATSDEGLRNLFRLHATSYADGFYRKPRIDIDTLAAHSTGLVVTSGCAGGIVATRIRLQQYSEAKRMAGSLRDIFGENFLIEIMEHDNPIDKIINPDLIRLSREIAVPLIATNDSHYTTSEDAYSHDALLCISTRQRISGVRSFKFEGTGYHLRSFREMDEVFRQYPESLQATLDVAARVEEYSAIFEGVPRFPRFEQRDYPTNEEYLYNKLQTFLDNSSFRSDRDAAQQRSDYEFDIISGNGFTDYILTLKEMIDFAHEQNIRVGPGRGSAAGSWVAYALGITTIDPLEHGLLFERFLNPERLSPPDIDVDIEDGRRAEIINWAVKKYGREFFAQIGTEGIIGAKSALHDSARVLGKPRYLSDRLVYRLPPEKFGRQPALREGDWTSLSDDEREVYDLATTLEGRTRNMGVHAAGVIISLEPLQDLIPLYRPTNHPTDAMVSAYDMNDVEAVGLVKYDWLGLKTLSIIEDAVNHINNKNIPWDIPVLSTDPKDLNDDKTFELLRRGDTLGVFQLDSPGMQQLLRSIKPTEFGDISAVLALYRPGPMGANAHSGYAKRKNGKERISYPHSELEKPLRAVLGNTYGLVVYQEQVLEILRICCGYTYATAEGIFNAMRKKDTKKMLAAKPDFTKRMSANGYSQDCINSLWNVLVPFSDYSFNKSHTTGYGVVSYWTAFLKTHYPVEYWAPTLSRQEDPKKLPLYIEETDKMGIKILPPDINDSNDTWTPTADGIRYGLKSIKEFGEKSFPKLVAKRPYRSLHDFFLRADRVILGKKNLSALIQAGALDSLCPYRTDLYLHSELLAEQALSDRALSRKGQMPLVGPKYDLINPKSPDHSLIQEWEKERLGTVLTLPPVEITTTRWLTEEEFVYIREICAQYPGRQALTLRFAYATVDVGFVNFTDKLKTQILSIGGIEVGG